MREEVLPGGNTVGAVRIGDAVHKRASPWTPTVHALLRHLDSAGVDGAPRALGFDEQGREMLTYMSGETVGGRVPWPAWVSADWDTAGPSSRDYDLAFTALSWVPLVDELGSHDLKDRSRRVHLLLDAYGYERAGGSMIGMSISARSIRLFMLAAAAVLVAVALGIRAVSSGTLLSDGRLEQYSGTALYASMVYVGVLFLRPRIASYVAGTVALGFCWLVEVSQLTGIPAALSAHSLVARLVLGTQFDWTDILWYPVGIVPLVAVDWLVGARTRRKQSSETTRASD